MKESKNTSSRNNIITLTVCVSVVLLAVILVAMFIFYPTVAAKNELESISQALQAEVDSIVITNPDQASIGFGGGAEIRLSGDEATELAVLLRDAVSTAKYSHRHDSSTGNWDTRVRVFTENGDDITLYVTTEGSLYFSRGITQFHFSSDYIERLYEALTQQTS